MKSGTFFTSIRFKIAIAFFIVFATISSLTNYSLFGFLKSTLRDSFEVNLQAETKRILDDVGYAPIQIPLTNADQLIYIWYRSNTEFQEIYRKDGFPEDLISIAESLELFSDSVETTTNFVFPLDTSSAGVSRSLIESANSGVVSVMLLKSATSLNQEIKSVRNNLIRANILALSLSLFLAYIVSGITLRPIQGIIAKANLIKAGPEMDRLPVGSSGDEIAQLSSTMNAMIQRIESSIKDQNRFFASAAHELRTPLANMQSELEYRISTDKNADPALQSLRDEVIRLKNVVQDFLLVSQLKTENLELRKSLIRFDDLIYDVLEKLRPTLKKAGFSVKLSLEENIPRILMDPEKMESLIVNLIDNAQKYGDRKEAISISISVRNGSVELLIQNKIGKPDIIQGNGLGLWVCERIAHLHHFGIGTTEEKKLFTATISMPI